MKKSDESPRKKIAPISGDKKAAHQMKNNVRPIDIRIAKRVKKAWLDAKKRRGLTQRELAEKLGINQSAVSQYLNEYLPFNVPIILKFAAALGVDALDLAPEFAESISAAKKAGAIPIIGMVNTNTHRMTLYADDRRLPVSIHAPLRVKAVLLRDPQYRNTMVLLVEEGRKPLVGEHAVRIVRDKDGNVFGGEGPYFPSEDKPRVIPPPFEGVEVTDLGVYPVIGSIDGSRFDL